MSDTHTQPTRPSPQRGRSEPGGALDALTQMQGALTRIRELHHALAAGGDPGGALDQELLALIQQRGRLADELGAALVRWLAGGGVVVLEPPASSTTLELVHEDHRQDNNQAPKAVREPSGVPAEAGPAEAESTEALPIEPSRPDVSMPSPAPPAGPAPQPMASAQPQPRTTQEQQEALRRILNSMGRPQRPRTLNQVHKTAAALDIASKDLARWRAQPQPVQRALVGLTSSLARHLQDEQKRPIDASDAELLRGVFSSLSRWSREFRPGFVPGLSRNNSPENGSWMEDARSWWRALQGHVPANEEPVTPTDVLRELQGAIAAGVDKGKLVGLVQEAVKAGVSQSDPRLVAMLAPHHSMVKGVSGLKTLKSRLRAAVRQLDTQQENEDARASAIPDDWPCAGDPLAPGGAGRA